MPSRFDTISAQSASVVGSGGAAMSQWWQYRPLTSQPSAQPRTYGDWAPIVGLPTGLHEVEQFDPDRNVSKLVTVQSWRMANQPWDIQLTEGWQLQDPQGQVWQVLGIESAAVGTIKWQIGRDTAIMATPDRKTGV